ncbi:hypothetical protein ACWDR8_18390, partial [Nocardia farcinica]
TIRCWARSISVTMNGPPETRGASRSRFSNAARAHALAAALAAHDRGPVGAPVSASPLLHQLPAAIRTLRALGEVGAEPHPA